MNFQPTPQDFTPIATEYDGWVFRSRTEAYMYEYYKLTYPDATITYESQHYSKLLHGDDYTPDFIIGSPTIHMGVEVKPRYDTLPISEWHKYQRWMETHSIRFEIATPKGILLLREGMPSVKKTVNELRFKQAYNNVMTVINPRGYLRVV